MNRLPGILGHRWTVMGLWLVSGVSGIMMAISIGILLPSIRDELGLTPTQQGFFGSSAFLGNLLLALPISWWVSRYRPKILTTITLILATLFLATQALAPNFLILLLGRLGYGLSTLAREPARALLMHQWFSPREFIFVNSIYNALFGLVVGGGLAATPFILSAVGDDWRTVLYTFFAVLSVMTLLWILVGKERHTDQPESQETTSQVEILKRIVGYRDLWIAGFGFTGATIAWSSFLNFYPTLMLDTYEVSLNWSGAILGLGIVAGGVAGIALSRMISSISAARRQNTLQALGIIMLVTYLAMTMVDSIPLLLVISAVNGIGWGFWPILSSVPFYLPGIRPRQVAISVSFIMTMASLGTVIGPSMTGIIQDQTGDLRLALTIVSFAPISLAVSGALLRIRTDTEPEPSTQPAD